MIFKVYIHLKFTHPRSHKEIDISDYTDFICNSIDELLSKDKIQLHLESLIGTNDSENVDLDEFISLVIDDKVEIFDIICTRTDNVRQLGQEIAKDISNGVIHSIIYDEYFVTIEKNSSNGSFKYNHRVFTAQYDNDEWKEDPYPYFYDGKYIYVDLPIILDED